MSSPLVASPASERIEARTIFGVRFWDALLAHTISNGLHVRAQRILQSNNQAREITGIERIGRIATGRQTPNGTFIFPQLHSTVRLTNDDIEPHRVLIEMDDRLNRYLPLAFTLQLPSAEARPLQSRGAGVAQSPLTRALPASEEHGVLLYSAPGRTPPPGAAILYAQIASGDNEAAGTRPPAAPFALVEVRDLSVAGHAARSYFGMSDAAGALMLPIPYPLPSKIGDSALALRKQEFEIKLELYFQSAKHFTAPGSQVPLLSTLLAQKAVQMMVEVTPNGGAAQINNVDQLGATLLFGQPLVIRTRASQPYLRIVA